MTAHAIQVAEGLAARGVEVTMLTVRHSPELKRDEVINGVRVVRLQLAHNLIQSTQANVSHCPHTNTME